MLWYVLVVFAAVAVRWNRPQQHHNPPYSSLGVKEGRRDESSTNEPCESQITASEPRGIIQTKRRDAETSERSGVVHPFGHAFIIIISCRKGQFSHGDGDRTTTASQWVWVWVWGRASWKRKMIQTSTCYTYIFISLLCSGCQCSMPVPYTHLFTHQIRVKGLSSGPCV